MIRRATCDVKSFCYAATLLGVLQLVSCWPSPSNDIPADTKYEDIDLISKRPWNNNLSSWGKRSWQNLQGGWGKRSNEILQYLEDSQNRKKLQKPSWHKNDEQIDGHIPFEEIVSVLQKDIRLDKDNYDYSDQDNEFTIKEKRGWNRLPTWGKRAKWSNIGGSWGKKDPAWTNLKGIWGKRNSDYQDEPNS